MLSSQVIDDMCRLSVLAYRSESFIMDLYESLDECRPLCNEVCVLERCLHQPTLIQGDLTSETDIIQNDAQAYVCRYQDSLAIVFRGTESFRDVLTDVNIVRVRMDLPGVTGDARPKVHWGFLRQFRTVEDEIREHIEPFINRGVRGDVESGEGEGAEETKEGVETDTLLDSSSVKHIIISGHSLGGALATLAAVQFTHSFPEAIIDCVTFGSPRVGDK